MRTIKVGVTLIHIHCKRFHVRKKYCDVECDFVCQLNKNGGSKNVLSLHDIAKEFHVTANQLKCAVHDCVIHAEILKRGSKQAMFLSKDEVAEKLETIRAYPKKSAEEIERRKNNHRFKHEKNNTSTENLSDGDDLCPLTKASCDFGISTYKLYTALEHGIIHSRPKNGVTKYLVSRSEIQQNMALIKKSSKIFYRLLNMKKQKPSQEGQQILEIHQQVDESVPKPVDSCNLCEKC
jgi:hypothetical protein